MRLIGIFIGVILIYSCGSDTSDASNTTQESNTSADLMLNDTTCDCTALEIDEKKNIIHLGGTEEPYTGWCVLYRRGGRLESKRQYKDGKLNGPFLTYHPNGNLESSIPHVNNRYNGLYLKLNEKGDTVYQRIYRHGAPVHSDSIQ
ncbi:MAG: hypothetical protein KDC84_06085 [Crocinitomicaceae bacterium]|nr:hypothetical protein [Crocinitomicaceae bacterium]